MTIDKGEIRTSFRLAKDKRNQIAVLADLNQCSPWHVATLLDEMGELRQHELKPDMFSNHFTPVGGTKKTKTRGQKRPRVGIGSSGRGRRRGTRWRSPRCGALWTRRR